MKKKSIMAFGLAALLTVGTCIPVMADNTQGGNTTVSYNVQPTYTVDVPANISMTGTDDKISLTLKDENLLLDDGASVNVDIASSHTDRKVSLTGKGAELSVAIGSPTLNGKLTTGGQTCDFTLTPDTPTKAGKYTGTVSFVVTYDNGTAGA